MTTDPPDTASDQSPGLFRWPRVGHWRIRAASQVDCTALAALADGSGRTTARLPAPISDGPDPWTSVPVVRLVERDRQIVAGAGLAPGALEVRPGRHPWSRLVPPDGSMYRPSPPVETLAITGIVYGADELPATWLEAIAGRACQRSSARRAIAFAPLRPPHEGADWTPEAFLQQVYFGPPEAPELDPFLDADFVPRGLASPEDFPFEEWRVLMVWENARR